MTVPHSKTCTCDSSLLFLVCTLSNASSGNARGASSSMERGELPASPQFGQAASPVADIETDTME